MASIADGDDNTWRGPARAASTARQPPGF